MNKLGLLLIGISFALRNAEGETVAASQERIAGGLVVSNYASVPYMVSVQLWNERNNAARGHRCGGALITSRHVVTIARCVVTITGTQWVANNPNLYRVFNGHVNLDQSDVTANNRRITHNFPHPNFQPSTFFNDIAVLVTNSAFVLGNNWLGIRSSFAPAGLACQFTGWGGITNTLISMQMRMLTVLTSDTNQCALTYNNSVVTGMVGTGNICSSNPVGHAPCDYDLGGPLVCANELVGLLSWASHCDTFPGFPSIYTRIDAHANWIRQIIATSDASTARIISFLLPVVALYHFIQNVKLY